MTRLNTTIGLLVACLLAACERQTGNADFVQIDSAGVAILESLRAAWEAEPGWTVAVEPELAIGAGPTGGDDPNHPPWGFIREVHVLSDGSLVVGDITTSEVTVFDSVGQFTLRFGGQGDGPGELADFSRVYACEGDTIIAADPFAYNFFDSEGRFIRRLETVDGRTRTPLNVFLRSGDCQRFLVTDDRYRTAEPEGPEGLTYWDFAWTDDSFMGRDTVARVPANHVHLYDGFTLYAPWTTSVYPIRLAGDDVLFGYSQRTELRIVAPNGELKRILRWHATPDPITTEERRQWNEEQQVGEGGFRLQLDDFPWLPEHKAFFDRLLADDEGNLWVRTPPPPDPAPERWTVLGSEGHWLGVVQMPGGFRLIQVARGRVYGIHRDELGVATVRVHHLDKGG